jgi:DNA-binding transcriptional ArsR family regulator
MQIAMHATPDSLFAAPADPTRRRIFEWLSRDGEQTVRAPTGRAWYRGPFGLAVSARSGPGNSTSASPLDRMD